MDKTRGGPSAPRAPPKAAAAQQKASNGRRRPALVRAFRGAYDIVHYTEKQCNAALTSMLGEMRGIVRPEKTTKRAKAVGADTSQSRSEIQIRNRINNPINNLIARQTEWYEETVGCVCKSPAQVAP